MHPTAGGRGIEVVEHIRSEPDSLIARKIVVFPAECGLWATSKWQSLKEKDSVAVDRVQGEPVSGQFPANRE
jgi:hypothetical protein